jgi:hypothetical protein
MRHRPLGFAERINSGVFVQCLEATGWNTLLLE